MPTPWAGVAWEPVVQRRGSGSGSSGPSPTTRREPQGESKVQTIDKDLMMKLKTSLSTDAIGRRAKAEKKETHTQVAFGEVNSLIARSFPTPRSSSSDVSAAKLPKACVEPHDYTHTKYPVTLPLRRPYSGDSEILDEEEFGESSSIRAQDGELTAAEELGLMDRMNEPQLLFFQLPAYLSLPRQAESVAEADTDNNEDVNTEGTKSKESGRKRRHQSIHGCKLKELPGGLMGKILVYKCGKLKMRLGDALFDVCVRRTNRRWSVGPVSCWCQDCFHSAIGKKMLTQQDSTPIDKSHRHILETHTEHPVNPFINLSIQFHIDNTFNGTFVAHSLAIHRKKVDNPRHNPSGK